MGDAHSVVLPHFGLLTYILGGWEMYKTLPKATNSLKLHNRILFI